MQTAVATTKRNKDSFEPVMMFEAFEEFNELECRESSNDSLITSSTLIGRDGRAGLFSLS
jgi:hypothetical protein